MVDSYGREAVAAAVVLGAIEVVYKLCVGIAILHVALQIYYLYPPDSDTTKKEAASDSTEKTENVDVDNLPDDWSKTTNNGFTHVRDADGNIRVRIDPADANTPYPHKHLYDENGNSLDVNGNIVDPKSQDAHIPLK